MSQVLFISVNDIKKRTGLTANVEEKLVLPEIYTAQDMYILPSLGSALYKRLLKGIVDNDLNVKEQDLIDNYITPSLVFFVMAELPMGLSYQFYNKGVIRKADNNATEPNVQELIEVSDKYRARAEFYKDRLVSYLRSEAEANTFPEYNNPGDRLDTISPDNDAYRASMILTDVDLPKDRIVEGPMGPQGERGFPGLSNYEIAVQNGFTGSEADWLLTIKGEKGDTGDTGATGAQGISAYEVAVLNGYVGTEAQWLASLVGPQGIQGIKGDQGEQGPQGEPGPSGSSDWNDLTNGPTSTPAEIDAAVQSSQNIKKSWIFLAGQWSESPVLLSTISSGKVYKYSYLDGIRYRLVPEPYDPASDAFYTTFNGTALSGLITTRSTI